MSSCCVSVSLLVLLGVVLASASPVHFPERLRPPHEAIADMLGLKKPEIGNNSPFSSVIKTINTSCQRREEAQLLNATLDVYMQIFSSILHRKQHHDNTGSPALLDHLSDGNRVKVETALTELQQEMEKVKARLGHPSHNKEDALRRLHEIKVDDPMVQKKALADFKEVYQAANLIGSRRCGSAHSSSAE